MTRTFRVIDRVLRADAGTDSFAVRPRHGVAAVAAGGVVYGAVMGSFSGFTADGLMQATFSAVKVPLLILVTAGLALPFFFVANSLVGLRDDFPAVLRALASTQAVVAVVLAVLAPYTAVWYLSTADYREAVVFNAAVFAVASGAAQWTLRRRYAPLIARDRRHRAMLRAWLGVYAFVGIQMGWVLRPFIGEPGAPVAFFRPGAWGNAYVTVAELVWQVVSE